MAKNISRFIKTLPDKTSEIYSIFWHKMTTQVNIELASVITQCLLLTHWGLRETDLKVLVCSAPFNYSEEAFYFTFLYLKQELYLSSEQRYCLRFRDIPNTGTPLLAVKHLSKYLQTLSKDDIVRYLELPLAFLQQGDFENFYCEFRNLCNRPSLSQQVLHTIVTHYELSFKELCDASRPNDVRFMSMLMEITEQTCSVPLSAKGAAVIMEWLRDLTARYIPSKCLDTQLYWFGIFRCTANYASAHGTSAEQITYKAQKQQLFSEIHPAEECPYQAMQAIGLLNIEILEGIAQARNCLDEGLPIALCSHILFKINSLFHDVGKIIKEDNFSTATILASEQLIKVLGSYYEICGDIKYKEDLYQEAMYHYQKSLSTDNDATVLNRNAWIMKCAVCAEKMGNYPEALRLLKQSLTMLLDTASTEENIQIIKENIGLTYGRIGGVLLAMHKYSDVYRTLKKRTKLPIRRVW